MRSGWYAAWMDDCDLPQQLPLDWNDDWSPSTLMARPFCTVTHTPHSIFPQPRQHVRTRFTSSPRAAAPASSASAAFGATAAAQANAAPVTAVSFVNARRVRLSFPIPPPSPSRPCGGSSRTPAALFEHARQGTSAHHAFLQKIGRIGGFPIMHFP